jgi:MFS family permease
MASATTALEGRSAERAARRPLVTPLFVLIVSSTFAYFVAIGALMPALPLYVERSLGGGSLAVGLAVGSFSVSALVLRPWAGRLGDRRGRRVLIVGGAALAAASAIGYLAATSLAALVALRVVAGAGEALFFIGVVSAANDVAPDERRGEAMSLFSLAPYAGVAVGPAVAEAVLGDDRFAAVWLLAAACALAAAVLGARLTETSAPAAAPARSGPRRLLHPAGLVPGAVLCCIFWGFAGFNAFVPLYARQLGLGGSWFVFAAFSTVLLSVRSFGAGIPDRLGPARAGRSAVVGAAVGLGVIGTWPTPAGLLAGTVVFAGGQALAFPALMALAVRRAPASERSSVVATFTAFLDLALGVAPITLGAVAGAAGYRATFLVAACVAGGGFLLLVSRRAGLHRGVDAVSMDIT